MKCLRIQSKINDCANSSDVTKVFHATEFLVCPIKSFNEGMLKPAGSAGRGNWCRVLWSVGHGVELLGWCQKVQVESTGVGAVAWRGQV